MRDSWGKSYPCDVRCSMHCGMMLSHLKMMSQFELNLNSFTCSLDCMPTWNVCRVEGKIIHVELWNLHWIGMHLIHCENLHIFLVFFLIILDLFSSLSRSYGIWIHFGDHSDSYRTIIVADRSVYFVHWRWVKIEILNFDREMVAGIQIAAMNSRLRDCIISISQSTSTERMEK